MAERSTADIVAELRKAYAYSTPERRRYDEAADRLAELDAKPCAYVRADDKGTAYCTLTPMMAEEWHGLLAEHQRIDALRPPCPTCGGTKWVGAFRPAVGQVRTPCPENDGNCDGKVSIERLVKVFEAVFDANVAKFYGGQANGILHHLRGIR